MAWTTPKTDFVPGNVLTAAQMNAIGENLLTVGGAWTSYTPTLAQGGSTNIAKTVTYAKYLDAGAFTVLRVSLTATAAGTTNNAITITLPTTAATASLFVGTGWYDDAGVAYRALSFLNSTTTLSLFRTDSTAGGQIGVNPNIAVANGDVIFFDAVYESVIP